MLEQVEILSAEDYTRRKLYVPSRYRLRFPRSWKPDFTGNRYAASIERETLAWLRSHGIGSSPHEAEKLAKFNCAKYGGYSLPMADYRAGLLVTQFISLWLFWDDVQVEQEEAWDIEEVVAALTGSQLPCSSCRYVAAWADLGQRLRRTQSEAWLQSLVTAMRQWLENAKLETRMAKAFKGAGALPSVARLFDCRTISIGMYPTFYLIEYAEGVELGELFHQHPIVVEMKRIASRLVGMGNDLGGLARDIANRWLNLVLVLMQEASTTIVEAFQSIVDIHNADVLLFERLASQLPTWGDQRDVLVQGWVQAVRYNIHGFTLWEATSERYREYRAILGKKALVAPVCYVRPGRGTLV